MRRSRPQTVDRVGVCEGPLEPTTGAGRRSGKGGGLKPDRGKLAVRDFRGGRGNPAWPRNATLRAPKGRSSRDQSLHPRRPSSTRPQVRFCAGGVAQDSHAGSARTLRRKAQNTGTAAMAKAPRPLPTHQTGQGKRVAVSNPGRHAEAVLGGVQGGCHSGGAAGGEDPGADRLGTWDSSGDDRAVGARPRRRGYPGCSSGRSAAARVCRRQSMSARFTNCMPRSAA